jgi:hypothetical protein
MFLIDIHSLSGATEDQEYWYLTQRHVMLQLIVKAITCSVQQNTYGTKAKSQSLYNSYRYRISH